MKETVSINEVIMHADGPEGLLEGTFTDCGKLGAETVLIVPGSGSIDRDGNNLSGILSGIYKKLAIGLAELGFNSLRIDKRGLFGSHAAILDANNVTLQDYSDDIDAWMKVLKRQKLAKCIWLFGHSEGGLAALLNARSNPDLSGLILAATPGIPLADILLWQLKANPANAEIMNEICEVINALEADEKIPLDELHPALQGLFHPNVQGYFSDLMSYDPAKMIANLEQPILLLQGRNDLQVSVQNINALSKAQPVAGVMLFDDLNHVLKEVGSNSATENFENYSNPDLPIPLEVTYGIANFITKHASRKE